MFEKHRTQRCVTACHDMNLAVKMALRSKTTNQSLFRLTHTFIKKFNTNFSYNFTPPVLIKQDDEISGSNWLWEMLTLIYRRQSEVVDEEKMSAMLEAQSLEETANLPSPRILNTHLLPKYLPKVKRKKFHGG